MMAQGARNEMTPEEKEIFDEGIKKHSTKAMAGSEDCLNLAVFTPRSPKQIEDGAQKLPVMFFIHGGAFYMGAYIGMGPKALLEHDVVLVEIQYRVGPLGTPKFLAVLNTFLTRFLPTIPV